jgi:Flp pilus assembly protein TadD
LLSAAPFLPGQETAPGAPAAAPDFWPSDDVRDLLAVDDEMRAFFASRVDRNGHEHEILRDIVVAILRPGELGFVYDPEGTYDARETFRRRRGNCQGFAFLAVAMAREYRLHVAFQDIGTLQLWNRFDRFIASVRHTNVRMIGYGEDYIIDLRPDLGRPTFANDRFVVKDERAFAHFYTTAGFFRLVHGDAEGARRLMQRATEVDGSSAIVWSNLGNLHLQLGELAPARDCFERALRIDAKMDDALTGLVRVLRLQGGPEDLKLAAKHEHRAQAYRERNPYYVHHLGVAARERGDRAAAEGFLRRAIRLKKDEPLFHEELAALLRAAGREDEARRAEARLAKVRKELDRIQTYVLP